jgi:hypothetical protein
MPVSKYRRVDDMPPPWHEPGDPALYRAIRELWSFGQRWHAPRFPPGVYRLRSPEEMNRLAEQWEVANFAAFHARRSG